MGYFSQYNLQNNFYHTVEIYSMHIMENIASANPIEFTWMQTIVPLLKIEVGHRIIVAPDLAGVH